MYRFHRSAARRSRIYSRYRHRWWRVAHSSVATVTAGDGTTRSGRQYTLSRPALGLHAYVVSSQHSQLTPKDTHHIHTALQDLALTDGVGTRRVHWWDNSAGPAVKEGDLPATTHPPQAYECMSEGPNRMGRQELHELARDRPFVQAQRRLNPLSPPWEPLVALARAGQEGRNARGAEDDESGPELAMAMEGPTMTPPTPITARPHLASGHAGAMLRQLTHDPVGSISEPAGAS